jgi:hypothetical protein
MTYVDKGLAQGIREIFGMALAHTYTRTPRTAGPRDAWATTPQSDGTPVTGVACSYADRASVDVNDGGFAIRSKPLLRGSVVLRETLMIDWDDPLKEDDLVSEIRDQDGTLLLAGPAVVVAVLAHAGFGPTTQRIAVLRGPDEEAAPE